MGKGAAYEALLGKSLHLAGKKGCYRMREQDRKGICPDFSGGEEARLGS